jgi:hypothetical protein
MGRIFSCVSCRAILEEIRLADGSLVVVCITCDTIGNAHEVALGASLIPADSGKLRTPRQRRAS